VIDYEVYEQRPEDQSLVVPTVEAHVRALGRAPQLLAADRGFWVCC
jgi:transposase, IS5 family